MLLESALFAAKFYREQSAHVWKQHTFHRILTQGFNSIEFEEITFWCGAGICAKKKLKMVVNNLEISIKLVSFCQMIQFTPGKQS